MSARTFTCTTANHSLFDWNTLQITRRLTDWWLGGKKVTGGKKGTCDKCWVRGGTGASPPRGVMAGGRFAGKKTQRGCGWCFLSANHHRDEHKCWLLATHNQSQTESFWLCHSLLCLAAHHSLCACVPQCLSAVLHSHHPLNGKPLAFEFIW